MTAAAPMRHRARSDYRQAVLSRRVPRNAHLYALDGFAAVAAIAVYVRFAITEPSGAFSGPAWLGVLVAFGVGLPLAVRRRWPATVYCVVLLACTVSVLLHITREPLTPLAYTAYTLALIHAPKLSLRLLLAALVSGAAVLFSQPGLGQGWESTPALTGIVLWITGSAWLLGYLTRIRRHNAEQNEHRRTEQAVAEERLRIARELHDVVAHSMSMIAVKAGIANHVAQQQPEQAHEALRVIESTSKDALTEMRRMLGMLRSDDAVELTSAPELTQLPGLAERAELAGVRVELAVHDTDAVPDTVALSVYRIVQEALTNVVRHARATHCEVHVDGDEHEVRVAVRDNGIGALPQPASGHGLIGMRERTVMHSGQFTAGPTEQGGFAVAATLPYEPSGGYT